jgi:hypothetical protein
VCICIAQVLTLLVIYVARVRVHADAASRSVKQANLYQAPDKMAGPSTRFLPYLTGNAMSGRPDGYGLRVWEFKPDSDLINVRCMLLLPAL